MSDSEHADTLGDFLPKSLTRALDVIFTISTGALALSITFRSEIVSQEPVHIWILASCWVALTLSALFYVLLQLTLAGLDIYSLQYDLERRQKFDKAERTNKVRIEVYKEQAKLVDGDAAAKLAEQVKADCRKEIESLNIQFAPPKSLKDGLSASYVLMLLSFTIGIVALLAFALSNLWVN